VGVIAVTYPWAASAKAAWDTVMRRVAHCPVTGCWFWEGPVSRGARAKHRKPCPAYPSISFRGGWAAGQRGGVRGPVYVLVCTDRDGPGLVGDHRCRQPLCLNPDHIEAVTAPENGRRVHTRRL